MYIILFVCRLFFHVMLGLCWGCFVYSQYVIFNVYNCIYLSFFCYYI